MQDHHVSMAPNGRLVIPADVRSALGMEKGGAFVLSMDADGVVHLEPMNRVVQRVQNDVARYVAEDDDLADALVADRRREAADD